MDIKTARKDKCCFWTAGEYFLSWITRVSKTKHWRHTPVGRAAAHTRVGRILPAAAAARTRACTVPSETWLYLILLPPVLYVHSSKVAQYGWRWGTTGEGINHCSSRARGGGWQLESQLNRTATGILTPECVEVIWGAHFKNTTNSLQRNDWSGF